jgi:parallel beta-helix repeat protein
MVWGNLCEDNADFSTESLESANLSAGIATYHCANNTICGNVLVNNAAGVCIGAWSSGNQVYNNTIIGGDYGIVTLWNVAGHNNVAKNNIIVNAEIAALGNSDAGTRPSAGDITLSATTGLITVTSSGTAFTTHSTGYAIVAGSGWGFVVSKTNNSVVIVQVVSAFSSTSFTNGNWQISFGGDQGEWANYSCLYGNAENVSAGSGQSLTVGTNNVTDDPLLDASYRPSSSSPCVDAGTQVAGVVLRDFYGKEINGTPDIGAVQRYAARSASTARTESTARTASTTRSYPMRRGIP